MRIGLDDIYHAQKPRGDARQQKVKNKEEKNLKGVSFGPGSLV